MTGILAFRMAWAMDRMERSRPPGVLSWTMSACARSACARSIAAVSRRAVTGVMAPSRSIISTGSAARAGAQPANATMERAAAATIILRISPSVPTGACRGSGSERAAETFDRLRQALNLGGRIVDGKARAQRAGDAEPLHERLRTVVPSAHRDTAFVEKRRAVVGVDALDVEGHYRPLDLRITRSVELHPGNALEGIEAASGEAPLMGGHALHPELAQVLHRRAQTDDPRDGRRAGLEAPGKIVPLGVIDPHFLDHLTPAPRGLQPVQHLAEPVENANARRSQHFVAGEHVEVRPQGGQIQGQVGGTLGTVEQDEGSGLVRPPDELGHGIDGSEDIRDVGHGHQPGSWREKPPERLHVEEAFTDHRHRFEAGAAIPADHLPGNQVRVVLHFRDDDLVPRLKRPPHALGNQIDRLRGAAREDDLLAKAGAHERAHRIAPALVELSRLLAQGVDGPMDVGVASLIVSAHRLDDLARLLARGRRVEIVEQRSVHHPLEDRKIRAATFAHAAHRATSLPSRAPWSTVRGSATHLILDARTSASSRSSRSPVVSREARSSGSPIARSSSTSAEATQIAQLSPRWRASASRPSAIRHSMRILSPQSGFTSSKAASGRSRLPW